jgi:hypothetical protein
LGDRRSRKGQEDEGGEARDAKIYLSPTAAPTLPHARSGEQYALHDGMRSESEESGLFSMVSREEVCGITHPCMSSQMFRQKRRNTVSMPWGAGSVTHTKMFDVALKATGL